MAYEAQKKYQNKTYDTIGIKVPKGTKETIKFITNDSVNGFINKAIQDRIYRIEHEMEVDVYEKD